MRKKRVLICDTYYPPAWKSMLIETCLSYEENLRKVLGKLFGTADFYSHWLERNGHEVIDAIVNHETLQKEFASQKLGREDPMSILELAIQQVQFYRPDVLFCQDLSFFPRTVLAEFKRQGIYLMGQCSCPFPPVQNVREFQTLFTSFPHYVDRFRGLGVEAFYNPLAFDPRVLQRTEKLIRNIPILFIGGVGYPSHWREGMDTLEAVARTFPESAHFYGYGYDTLPDTSAVKKLYRGEAWGRDMYQLMRKARIVINRHGEVAEGYTNNMRTYEATGCGALLFTEKSKNLGFFFEPTEVMAYDSVHSLIGGIEWALENPTEAKTIAQKGQERALRDHTYEKRMRLISQKLFEVNP